jgi:nickel-dependent lactate racemase
LKLPIPDDWKLQTVAVPSQTISSTDWEVRMAEALAHPVSGPPLSERLSSLGAGRLVIIVEDLTRNSPLSSILKILLDEIHHAGIYNEQMEFFVASGMHPHAGEEKLRSKLGPASEGIPISSNPWHDSGSYTNLGRIGRVDIKVDRGVIDADLRIIISPVAPHLQSGFGGGYKMLFPGCGELKSIRMLHRVGIARDESLQMVGIPPEKNMMRQVIDRAGRMVDAAHGSTFSVQYMLDAQDMPTHIAAGDPLPAHRMLTKKCAVEFGIVSDEPADILIANAHPRDYDLWQVFKCIPNTCWATRPGGIVICMGRCEKGLNEMKTMPWPLSPRWTRRIVRFFGSETISSMLDRVVAGVAGDSQWFLRLATQILQRNTIYIVSPVLHLQDAKFPGISIFPSIEEALNAARRHLGDNPQRVAVYPFGGASYPILSGKRASERS